MPVDRTTGEFIYHNDYEVKDFYIRFPHYEKNALFMPVIRYGRRYGHWNTIITIRKKCKEKRQINRGFMAGVQYSGNDHKPLVRRKTFGAGIRAKKMAA